MCLTFNKDREVRSFFISQVSKKNLAEGQLALLLKNHTNGKRTSCSCASTVLYRVRVNQSQE
jgi:hypothetical protein